MNKYTPFVLSLALMSFPVASQVMGSTNSGAPTIKQEIAFAGGQSFEVSYRSITWAKGQTMEMLANKENGARARQRVNGSAEKNPLGSLKTTAAFTIGGKDVPAGDYRLFFTIDDELKWHLVVAGEGDQKFDWLLDLKDSGHESPRLTISLLAGGSDHAANLFIAFGKQSGKVEVVAVKDSAAKEPAPAKAGK